MKIRKDDNVIVISGSDKGKTGKVLKAFPKTGMLLVEGINMKKKRQRATRQNQKGQVIEKMSPIRVSKVMLVESGSGKGTRVGKKLVSGKYIRISRKTGKEL